MTMNISNFFNLQNKNSKMKHRLLVYVLTLLSKGKISNIIVLGHSSCGGVQNIFPHFSEPEKANYNETIFIRRWLEILRPGFERIPKLEELDQNIKNLEKQTVVVSLENLLSFPFISEAINNGELSLHGLWYDIKSGELLFYDQTSDQFKKV